MSTELTARHLPHPRDLRTSLDRRRMQEADNDVGICSPGHGQATHAGTRGTLGSSQHLLRQHLLHSCICFPQVCIARICCAGALRGLAGRHQKVSRLVGAGTGLPRFPCSGPRGHRSCCSASVMLFQPLFALHCLLYLFFLQPSPSAPLLFPFASFNSQPLGGFHPPPPAPLAQSLPEMPRQGVECPGQEEELRNNLHGRVTLGLFVHRLDKSARRLDVQSTRVCI